MDIHHVGPLLDTDFDDVVAFYRELGLDLRETTTGPVRVAFFETESAEFYLAVREERGSASPFSAISRRRDWGRTVGRDYGCRTYGRPALRT